MARTLLAILALWAVLLTVDSTLRGLNDSPDIQDAEIERIAETTADGIRTPAEIAQDAVKDTLR